MQQVLHVQRSDQIKMHKNPDADTTPEAEWSVRTGSKPLTRPLCSVCRVWPDYEVGPGPPGRAGEEGQQVAHPQPLEEGPVVRAVRHQA